MKIFNKLKYKDILQILYYMIIMIFVYYTNVFLQKHNVKIYNSIFLYWGVFVVYLMLAFFLKKSIIASLYVVILLLLFFLFLFLNIKFSFLYLIAIVFLMIDAIFSIFFNQEEQKSFIQSDQNSDNLTDDWPRIKIADFLWNEDNEEIENIEEDEEEVNNKEYDYNDYIIITNEDEIFTDNIMKNLLLPYLDTN